jgi:hypothetical protein
VSVSLALLKPDHFVACVGGWLQTHVGVFSAWGPHLLLLLLRSYYNSDGLSPVIGTLGSSCACLLFAVIIPSAPYWAFGFPSAIISVLGADFVFAAGTLFVAKVSLPHEQSVAGALFQTMTQVREFLCYQISGGLMTVRSWALQLALQ